ncbi:MAG TPA: transporter [Vicinamibacterales bacterium]|nr:transporter [Vicinamibacterales bacterium]
MRFRLPIALALAAIGAPAAAQDLVPGIYTPSPVGFNVVSVISSFSKGSVTFDPSLPVQDGHSTLAGVGFGLTRTFDLAGRYANAGVILPAVYGHVQGVLAGQFEERRRTGQGDLVIRVAVNAYGARAMTPQEFAVYQSSPAQTVVGVSLTVVAPIGQYDASRIVNIGTNRWALKPEVGISRRRGRWTVEGDVAVVLFTDNTNYLNGGRREQTPIAAFQGHLIYGIRPGAWVAFDANFWRGGRITTNGVAAIELQNNSRVGLTLAVPVRRHQLRFAVSQGAYTRLGGDFLQLGLSYSYAWR